MDGGEISDLVLRLMNLAQPTQTMLMAGDIDMGHARALLAVDAATAAEGPGAQL